MAHKTGRRPDRTPSFQFYALDFIADRAVVAMTPLERGGYVMLLAHAWISDRPGWLPDDDQLLAALSGLGGHWQDCRAGVAKAFSIRKGWWIQKRMVRERRIQLSYFRVKSRAGKGGAKAMWQKKIHGRPIPLPMAKDGASASASASASVVKKNQHPTPLVNVVDREAKKALRAEWQDEFDETFWTAYPRKVGKAAALKVWTKLLNGHDRTEAEVLATQIANGLSWYKRREWTGREVDKIPHPTTWLTQRRWEDLPDGTE